jgi:ubiquinone/menaquinone biosynthesis C-methylase UbiE
MGRLTGARAPPYARLTTTSSHDHTDSADEIHRQEEASMASETNVGPRRTYLPAAGHDWLLPLYDPVVTLLGGDPTRRVLVEQAAIQPSHRVLEVGCGTGSLVLLVKRLHPGVDVVGLDPDPKALARARRKAARAKVSVRFDHGFADEMPYLEASFDRVFSSFMLHHLRGDEKEKTLREIRRVLKPSGSFHLLDFAGAETGAHGFLARWLHSSQHLREHSEDRIVTLLSQARLTDGRRVDQGTMLFGHLRIHYYRASASSLEHADAS